MWHLHKITFQCVRLCVMKNEEKRFWKQFSAGAIEESKSIFQKMLIHLHMIVHLLFFLLLLQGWINNSTNLGETKKKKKDSLQNYKYLQWFYISSWTFCGFFLCNFFLCYLHSSFPYTHPDLDIGLCLKRLNNDRIIWLQAKCKLFTNLVTEWQWTELDLYFFLKITGEKAISQSPDTDSLNHVLILTCMQSCWNDLLM